MKLQTLREQVLEANLEVVRRGLVLYTFGNASGISREDGLVVIKPSGVAYEELRPESMVVTRLDGSIAEPIDNAADRATGNQLLRLHGTVKKCTVSCCVGDVALLFQAAKDCADGEIGRAHV